MIVFYYQISQKKLKIEFNRKNTRLLFLPQLVRVVFHQEFSLQTYAKVVSQDLAKALVDSEQSLFMTENLTLIPKNVKIAECVLKFVHIKQSKESSFLVRMLVRLVQSLKAKTDMPESILINVFLAEDVLLLVHSAQFTKKVKLSTF